jgi:hypothetical protein
MTARMSFVLRPAWRAHRKEKRKNARPKTTAKDTSQFDNSGSC